MKDKNIISKKDLIKILDKSNELADFSNKIAEHFTKNVFMTMAQYLEYFQKAKLDKPFKLSKTK